MGQLAAVLMFATSAMVGSALAQDAAKPAMAAASQGPQYREFVVGDAKAPVTIIEYASLTCSHCAHFYQTAYQDIKKNYVETGKVRFVFRDYPLDGLAMAGAVLARCAPGDRGTKMIEMMFKNQDTWVRAEKPIEPLKGYAQLAGMSAADVDACLKNEQILNAVREVQNTATNLYKIQSTPTFFVDDEKVEGGRDYAYMAKLIDEKLAKKK
jgi:protein-disulfide isomerase